jgi:hypothetical protein
VLKPPHLSCARDDESEQRLKKELRLVSKVSHPRVVRVHDFGELRGAKAISMAFIDGESLKSLLLRREGLGGPGGSHRVAIRRGAECGPCRGCDPPGSEAAQHPLGRLVFITDFGLERSSSNPTTEITRPGERPGSPAYRSCHLQSRSAGEIEQADPAVPGPSARRAHSRH